MATQLFVNLPVKDLTRSVAFFTELGFSFNPQFTDENATCLVISPEISIMLLVEKFFQTFTKKALTDATQSTEVILSLSLDSREQVDDLMAKAVAAGGTVPKESQSPDFMYNRSFQDLDGHLWEVFYMDMTAMPTA